jgi:hypothetical protein
MKTRREFLLQSGRALGGAWLVGAEVARRILWSATENSEPYLVEVEKPEVELWAENLGDEYVFSLGNSYYDDTTPSLTWRDWLERKDVDVSRETEIRDFLEEWGWYRPEDGEVWVPPDLDDALPEGLLENYLEWEFVMHDSQTAKAFHYLSSLRLANRNARGEPLGALEFVEGACPGNNSCLVTTRRIETLGGLQQRLLQLGERVQLHIG